MTPAERLRKHQRALEKTQRELDRERTKLENQEKKLVQEIKKNAKNGQMGAVKVQAKDLVRTRRYIQKFYQMRTQLQAISLRIQTVRSNEQMMQSMKGATRLLGSMNKQMNLPALQRIAMEFEKENDIMDQRQEMMDDAIDDVTGLEDEEEGEEVVNQVLDEIGVDLGQAVSDLRDLATWEIANDENSWAKHRKDCKAKRFRRARLRRLWEAVAEVILVTMTFRPGWTAYGDETTLTINDCAYCIPVSSSTNNVISTGLWCSVSSIVAQRDISGISWHWRSISVTACVSSVFSVNGQRSSSWRSTRPSSLLRETVTWFMHRIIRRFVVHV